MTSFISRNCSLRSVSWNGTTLVIDLSITNENTSIRIRFDNTVIVRFGNESYRLKTMNSNPDIQGRLLSKIEPSELLDWVSEEVYAVHNVDAMDHYIIADQNNLIDVVSFDAPIMMTTSDG